MCTSDLPPNIVVPITADWDGLEIHQWQQHYNGIFERVGIHVYFNAAEFKLICTGLKMYLYFVS